MEISNQLDELNTQIINMSNSCGYTVEDIKSPRRDGKIVIARALIWLRLRQKGYKLKTIALATGRTHGTVINGLKKIKGYIAIGDKLTLETLAKMEITPNQNEQPGTQNFLP